MLAALVATAPLLLRGASCGHDFDFHLVSWIDARNSWRHGILYPHWAPSPNFGAGEPRFVFYPPLTWMLGAALGWVLPWGAVPAAMTFLLLAATGLATRALARLVLANGPAALAGCAAIFSGYALFTAYERAAYGELAGGFWIPLVLLFALRPWNNAPDSNPDSNPGPNPDPDHGPANGHGARGLLGSALPLALAIAGAWLSNAPVGVMASYLLAGVAVAAALLLRCWWPALRALAGAGLGLGLASFYLLPAAWQQRWIDVRQAVDDPGMRIENSWLFARHPGNPALELHDQVLAKVSILAVVMLTLTLLSLTVLWWRSRSGQSGTGRRWLVNRPGGKASWGNAVWIVLTILPAAILLLQLPVSLPLWNWLPKLRFLQFPWRWLVVLEAPLGILFAAAVWGGSRRRRWAALMACAGIFLGTTTFAGLRFFQVCDAEDSPAGQLASIHSGAGVPGTDEYAPPGADNTLVATGLPEACEVSSPAIPLGEANDDPGEADHDDPPAWLPEQGTCAATERLVPVRGANTSPEKREWTEESDHGHSLVLRLRNYPAWRVTLDGRRVEAFPQRDDGLMALWLPAGRHDIRIVWATTPDAQVGDAISVVSLLLWIALLWMEKNGSARPRNPPTGRQAA